MVRKSRRKTRGACHTRMPTIESYLYPNKGMNDSQHSVGSMDMNEITFGQPNNSALDIPNDNSIHDLALSRFVSGKLFY